jgi:hypothetical protein
LLPEGPDVPYNKKEYCVALDPREPFGARDAPDAPNSPSASGARPAAARTATLEPARRSCAATVSAASAGVLFVSLK